MDKEQKQTAKKQMMELMQAGHRWQEAATQAGVQTSRSTAYRWWQGYRTQGERALQDGRHGHPIKAREPVLHWLESMERQAPHTSSRVVQTQLKERFGSVISITHLNRLRVAHGRVRSARREEKNLAPQTWSEPHWQEGAAGLLLVAAASETGLLTHFEQAVATCAATSSEPSILSCKTASQLVLTLWLLGAIGLHRTSDLRSYTGDAPGLLTGRARAYGYFHTERFLAHLALFDGAEHFTTALGKWTTQLWQDPTAPTACFYIDGHRKPVYTAHLIPRGLIGRSGKILGCRALVLLHDEQGHPRLATTSRGDEHLTIGLPQILVRYEQATERKMQTRVIVDREGMAAPFLCALQADGYTMVTLLKTDQYQDLSSFTEIGPFVPLEYNREGKMVREVAPACFALPLPNQPGQVLPLRVALIRDWRKSVPRQLTEEEEEQASEQEWKKPGVWHADWKAKPTPAPATTAKLIPIVTTASSADAVELAQTYTRRWPVQENIIKDFLLPLGLDINHGYRKTPSVNSEVAKKRTAFEKRLGHVEQWAIKALERSRKAGRLYDRLWKQTKMYGDERYRELNDHQDVLREQGMAYGERRAQLKQEKALIDAELEQRWQRVWRTYDKSSQESKKAERYAQEQCELLRALEDLAATERIMYELDNRKDQIMTVFKLALANAVMWARDQYFPESYAHATWGRLAPFFHLAGMVTSNQHTVCVELRPFNDRRYNGDLSVFCQRVNEKQPRLPDGRLLQFSVKDLARPILHGQKQLLA